MKFDPNDIKDVGLVLEGGGMRGVFTCGVLDYLLDHHLYFPYVVGVSAGACNGLSYMSRQRGRAKYCSIDLLEKYQYFGLKYLWTQHSIMDLDLMYRQFPETIVPYDYEAYFRNPATFEMVTTDCVTGRSCYLSEKDDSQRVVTIAKASSSLPFVCPMVNIDDVPMLDGGIIDSIPVERALQNGFKRNVVVLTRNLGYRKKEKDVKVPHFLYKNYPRLRVALSHRGRAYNRQLDLVEQMERSGEVLVIRPQKPVEVDRIERNISKLTALYEEGYGEAERVIGSLLSNP